jgi:hypothetical protein
MGYTQYAEPSYVEDGILHIYLCMGFGGPTALGGNNVGYEEVRYGTVILDLNASASARPTGTQVPFDGNGVPQVTCYDALPHRNYRVSRKVGAGAYAVLGTMPTTPVGLTLVYADSTAVLGTQYTYKLSTLNGASVVDGAEVTVTPIKAPNTLVATPGSGNVTLTFSNLTVGATYNVYRYPVAGTVTEQSTVQVRLGNLLLSGQAGSPVVVTTGTDHASYYYCVTAVKSGSESAMSNIVTAAGL